MPIKNQLMNMMAKSSGQSGQAEKPASSTVTKPAPAGTAAPAPAPATPAKPAPTPTLTPPEIQQIAETSLSKSLMKKLIDGLTLSTDEQRQVALVCHRVGYL